MQRVVRWPMTAIVLILDAVLSAVSMILLGLYAVVVRKRTRSGGSEEAVCRLVVLQPNIAVALRQHGAETILENHQSPYPSEMTLLDPSGSEEMDAAISQNVRIVSWKNPAIERVL